MKTFNVYPFLLFLALVMLSGRAEAQYYLTGQDPASVHWRQIKTKSFRIIFPEGYEKTANEYANLLQLSIPYINQPYDAHLRRLNIVLHNRSTTSNAMVSPAPFHADFFEMPSQDQYAQTWQKQLTLHEYRHAVQMDKMRQGFTKALYYILGDQGTAMIFGLYLPLWFIEGDAVWSETVHSNSGRGRLPQFVYPLKAQVLDKKIYPYDKAQFGSFRNFVPDHYTLGYQLVTEGIKNYGTGLWNDVLNQVARKNFTLAPFTHRLEKNTGNRKVPFYHKAMNDLKSQWQKQDSSSGTYQRHSPKNRFYTSYLFPQVLPDGSLIAEKTSIDDIHRFVKISPTGKETRLFTPGFDFKTSLSANDSLLCWNEKSFDPRWSNRDYSVIKIYNYKTGKLRQLTRKSRYFAPALSPDGKSIVAVRVDLKGNYSLDFLNVANGRIIKTFHTPDNLFFMTPHWSKDGKNVVATVLGNKGKSLLLLHVPDLKSRLLLPFSYTEIKWPVMQGKTVVYTGTYEGKDNLYAVNIASGKVSRIFNSRFGATSATFAPNGNTLFFNNYTANGNQIASLTFPPHHPPFNIRQKHYTYLVDRIKKKNIFNLDDTLIPDKTYPEKKYSRIGHFFNPHSWSPLALDLDTYKIEPGVMLLSQNVLSTAVTMMGWSYDPNEQAGKLNFALRYYGWYPVLGLDLTYQNREAYLADSTGLSHKLRWSETNLSFSAGIPFNFSRGKWIIGLKPSFNWTEKFLHMRPGSQFEFKENHLTTLHYTLSAYNQIKRSPKDLYPQWGQDIRIDFEHTPFLDNPSNQWAMQGHLYFPGFIRHQSLLLYGGYDKLHEGVYRFSSLIATPRGYSGIFDDQMTVLKTDYAFPIAYPDLDLQGAMYLKRIYAQLFYDVLWGETSGKRSRYSGIGAELNTDWNFLGLFPNIKIGLRYTYAIDRSTHVIDFLIGINFY